MSEKTKGVEESVEMSRSDFLKAAGLGLGMAGLSAFMSSPVSAQEGKKGKYVIVITNGGNNPNRAIWSLLMADTILKKGWGDVHVWFTVEGADLCRKGHPETIVSPIFQKYGNALELMERTRKNGAKFGACPPCLDYFGATGDNKYEWIEPQGGDWLMKNIQDAWVVWF